MDLRELLRRELARRRALNPRYSLRAFARHFGIHHSTLAGIASGKRRLTPRTVRTIGFRLGLDASRIGAICVEENAAAILRLARSPRFRADSRWLAERSGIRLDDVNVALHHLVRSGRVRMAEPSNWITESLP